MSGVEGYLNLFVLFLSKMKGKTRINDVIAQGFVLCLLILLYSRIIVERGIPDTSDS